jgi:hypothetical protein
MQCMCEMCLVNNDHLNKSSHTSMNPPVSMVSMGTQPRSQGTLSPLGAKVSWQVVVTLFDFISQILSNKDGLDQWLPKILATMCHDPPGYFLKLPWDREMSMWHLTAFVLLGKISRNNYKKPMK